ncbi:MAG: alpha-galactosidase [Ruminococcaceae bacterium]|nr:alpha-galactosidase [Oscillospiraceae bacterium]
MKTIVTKQDMSLVGRIFKFTTPENIPITFNYNGETIRGIPSSWHPTVERQLTDSRITSFIIRGRNADGLEVKVEVAEYRDYPVTEYLAFFTNTGEQNTPIISDIRTVNGVIPGKASHLIHGNGDIQEEEGYEWYTTPMSSPKDGVCLHTDDGTSCNGAFPYMRLMFEDFGVNIAVGWTGNWVGDITYAENGASVSFGQRRCHFVIRPGETMRTPRVTFQAFEGDEDRGRHMWRRWYFDHILPKSDGRPIPPKCCMHVNFVDGHSEHTGATEENQLRGIDSYIKGGLHPDVWWIDAGWYPCDYNWARVGTWRADEKRFPNGLTPIGKKCAENGIDFLLWFEPERVFPDTELYNEHPEWLYRTTENGKILVDIGDPDCCDYIIELIDSVIKESGVKIYRQDLNMVPGAQWREHETEDRIGAMENLHIQGYYRFWDALVDRNPGLILDSCAGGGRRNDLETMRRAVIFHPSDIGLGYPPTKQKQHRQMFEWTPYFRAQTKCCDDPVTGETVADARPVDRYAYHTAMAPSMTDMTEWDAPEEAYALAREMQPIWRRAAEIMLDADYYPLTECRKSREDFYAMYFHNPDEKRGFVQAVRNNACPEETFTAYMTSLEPDVSYRFTNPETGEERVISGKAAAEGFTMTVELRAGQIWFFEEL